jgi:hypothetical protein
VGGTARTHHVAARHHGEVGVVFFLTHRAQPLHLAGGCPFPFPSTRTTVTPRARHGGACHVVRPQRVIRSRVDGVGAVLHAASKRKEIEFIGSFAESLDNCSALFHLSFSTFPAPYPPPHALLDPWRFRKAPHDPPHQDRCPVPSVIVDDDALAASAAGPRSEAADVEEEPAAAMSIMSTASRAFAAGAAGAAVRARLRR